MNIYLRKTLSIPYRIYVKSTRIRFWFLSRKLFKVGRNFRIGKDSVIVGGEHIQIGDGFSAHARTRLETYTHVEGEPARPKLMIGNKVSIGYDCHIGAISSITISDNVLIASRVYITDHFHGATDFENLNIPPLERKLFCKGPVVIEEDVWIGEGAVILPNVTIGRGSVVGANAVVTKSVPRFSIVGGVPAKVIRTNQNHESQDIAAR